MDTKTFKRQVKTRLTKFAIKMIEGCADNANGEERPFSKANKIQDSLIDFLVREHEDQESRSNSGKVE